MRKILALSLVVALLELESTGLALLPKPFGEKFMVIIENMLSNFKRVEDLTCEIEVVYYKKGKEDRHYHLTYYFKRGDRFRVDFSSPYKGVIVFYQGGDQQLTVKPFRFLPVLRLRFSVANSLVKTPSGQRIDQTDIKYFLQFVFKNLELIKKRESQYSEDKEQITVSFLALDYLEGKTLEKYRMVVSKENWLPIRVERCDQDNKPLEVTHFKNYIINAKLKDEFFVP